MTSPLNVYGMQVSMQKILPGRNSMIPKGAVDEMDNAVKSGFTKYTRVAIRLVPDAYGKINQQGWWDDKHWAMWGDHGINRQQ